MLGGHRQKQCQSGVHTEQPAEGKLHEAEFGQMLPEQTAYREQEDSSGDTPSGKKHPRALVGGRGGRAPRDWTAARLPWACGTRGCPYVFILSAAGEPD